MQQHTGPSLPCLDALNAILTPDKDTNFLSDLITQPSVRASITIDLAKALYDRLEKQEALFKSSKEVDWALEILGYGCIPPHSQFIKDERNHLKNIITIYDFLLSDEAEITTEGATLKISNKRPPILNLSDYHHQKICLKMLSHLTLIFDKRNFEKKPNPLVGDPRLREEEMKVPIKLCAMVIRIYDKFLNKAYPFLYTDHWEYIIKLISGLASFILQGSYENKFPERIHVAVVELLYNSWIFSGLQNEQTWLVFKQCIHDIFAKDTTNSKQNLNELTAKDIIVSYWTDICAELTAKLLIDLKCYEPPKLLLSSKDEKIEYNYNLLIINHNYNLLKTDVQQQKKKFTLFQQPFLFNISQEQVKYLWGKMTTLMPDSIGHARTYYLVIQGIRNIVNLLLRLGTLSKPTEEIQESSTYRIENKRIIRIDKNEHEYAYFKKLLNYITSKDKIKPNEKRFSSHSSQVGKAAGPTEEEKLLATKKKSKDADNTPSQILKRPQDDKLINTEKEYSWVVKTEKVPSGEYLLKLFGRLLFEGATMTIPGYEDARLLAINILCKIFTKACGPFPEAAVKRFYKVYLEYLETELNVPKLQTFFKHSTELFLVNHLPHNIVLQIPLVNKLVDYYTNVRESGFQDKILRGACNKICSSLLCFFNDENGLINSKYNYGKNVKDILYELLEVSFQKDKEAIVSHKLASTKSPHEEAKILARSAWNFMIYSILNCKINVFVSKISDGWFERSFPLLNNLALDILLVLGEINLMRDDYQSPSPLTADVASAGFNIIEKIKKFIELRIKDLNDIGKHSSSQKSGDKEEAIKQISSSFGILYTWLFVIIHLKGIENLDQRKEFPPAVEGTIKLLITYQNCEPFATSVKCMLASLLNRLGNGNFSRNSPFASSILLNENSKKYATLDEMTDKLEEKCLLSLAIGEDTIMSFYDLNMESTNEAIIFMVRNMVGRFVWFGELFYKLYCPSKKGLEEGLQEAGIKIPAFKEDEKKPKSTSFDGNPSSANQELELLLQQQFDIEEQYEETHTRTSIIRNRDRFASEASMSLLNETEEHKKARDKMNTIKMFLSSTGILSIKDLEKITHVPSGGPTPDLLKKLDSSAARCQILSSIFYVLSPSSEKLSEFPRTDKLFQNFIEDLGVPVDEDTLETGVYESIRTFVSQHKKVIYTSNPLYEMIFTLPNLLRAQMNIQEFSSVPPIIIIWNAKLVNPNESFYPYIINRLDIKGYKTALIITPLNEGYFSLNILKRDSDFMSFPPIKDFVCSYHMLVTLVPQIIISIYREYQQCHHKLLYHEFITNKMQDRQKHISNLINFSKKDDHPWELLKSFFDISKKPSESEKKSVL